MPNGQSSPSGYTLGPEELAQRADPNHEPDMLGQHIAEGVAILHMTAEQKALAAADMGMTPAEHEQVWARVAKIWTEHLDRDQLTPDQYRALFDVEKPR